MGKWNNEHKSENAGENHWQVLTLVSKWKRQNQLQRIRWLQINNRPNTCQLMIAPVYKWRKQYKLRGSDHFPIIIENWQEVSTKQDLRWSIESANYMQFQKECTITTKVQDENTTEELHSCLVKTILQAAEKTTSVAWWNIKCVREERIMKAEYWRDQTNTTKLRSFQRRRAIKQRIFRKASKDI